MTISLGTRHLLVYSLIKGIGPKRLREWVSVQKDKPNNGTQPLPTELDDEELLFAAEAGAVEQIERAAELGARIISPVDAEYPRLLADSPEYPPLLWVSGTLSQSPDKSVAVIGPREPTRHGLMISERISRYFVEQCWSVVSGLAIGCDTAAHNAALAAGGHTVAVLAHGLQMISPAENKDLAKRIVAEGGALVSEFPIGSKPQGHQFVQRDRTQAGFSQGVVMVQSDLKGGSLHAPRAALSYGRWVGVPAPTTVDLSEKAPKIEANKILIEGSLNEKIHLMRCDIDALKRLVILQGRDDYSRMIVRDPSFTVTQSIQQALI